MNIIKAIKDFFTRKCAGCRKPLEFKNEWERRYKIYCKSCGWKP